MEHIDRVEPTLKSWGVRATSKTNAPVVQFYSELSDMIQVFYEKKDLIYIPVDYKEGVRRYSCKVFEPSLVEVRCNYLKDGNGNFIDQTVTSIINPTTLVNFLQLPSRNRSLTKKERKHEHTLDFPTASFSYVIHQFAIYFDSTAQDRPQREQTSFQQRDDFFDYARGLINSSRK